MLSIYVVMFYLFIGRYAKTVLKCLFVDRFNEGSRAQALEAIKSRVKDENNPAQILIFPEGLLFAFEYRLSLLRNLLLIRDCNKR